MTGVGAVVRNELRLLRHDPVPAVLLLAMPMVLIALLAPALRLALVAEGYPNASGGDQAVPGMVCVFTFFAVALVGFGLFREHGWRTWVRLRAAGIPSAQLLAGKLAVPAGLLVLQHLLLFDYGLLFLGMRPTGSRLAMAAVSAAFGAAVLGLALAAAAALATIQQVNAVTNLGAMVLGGIGGGFVPVSVLPGWVQPIAPISPTFWAMKGYRTAILDGGALGDVARPIVVLALTAAVFGIFALTRLRLDDPKRTWG